MDLTPTTGEHAVRAEVRGWLHEHLPWEYGRGLPPRFDDLADEVAFGREWQAKLAAARWVGVAWPEQYGGRGAGPVEHFIVTEELARVRAPELVGRIGINLVGPTLLANATPAQQQRWLPKILSAGELWCQLFSEPGAGSDLAAVATRATPVDGGWVVNGQKVWTSYAEFADWGVCLARTDPDAPKQHGISYLVVDMHAPGVEVRPLRQITDESEFNEVFFTDVFVPREQLIGPENEGWRVTNSTLSHERGINPRQLVIHIQLVEELLRLALETGAYDDHRLRQRVAAGLCRGAVVPAPQLAHALAALEGPGAGPRRQPAQALLERDEQAPARLGHGGPRPLRPALARAQHNPADGNWQRSWLYYQASSIWAGANEIQRNIIGERVLTLPREPRT